MVVFRCILAQNVENVKEEEMRAAYQIRLLMCGLSSINCNSDDETVVTSKKLTELITETDKMVDAFLTFEQNGMKQ